MDWQCLQKKIISYVRIGGVEARIHFDLFEDVNMSLHDKHVNPTKNDTWIQNKTKPKKKKW